MILSAQKRGRLWTHSDFLKLWVGQTASLLGSAITTLAFPLIAISLLRAMPSQMGLLSAIGQLAPFLVAPLIGTWVDRTARRPLLITADIGRALLLALIPLASLLHLLRIEVLYLVSFLMGVLSVVFTIASRSYLPSLIEREQLVEGNSALQVSRSAAQIMGPNLAGIAIQLVTAPLAILGDSLSFILSALLVWRIRTCESVPPHTSHRQGFWREIGEGWHAVMHNPILRAIAANNSAANIAWGMQLPVVILYMTREVGVNAVLLGMIYTCGNVGFLIGSLLAKRLTRRYGLGAVIIGAPLVSVFGALLIPLVHGPAPTTVVILAIAQFLIVCPLIMHHILEVSLRQTITPEHLQGRVNATMQMISWATTPLGALLGGWLGESVGLRPTLFLSVVGLLFAFPWIWFSPVRRLRELPSLLPEQD